MIVAKSNFAKLFSIVPAPVPIKTASPVIVAPVPTIVPAPAPSVTVSDTVFDTIILRRGGKFMVNDGFDETDSANVAAGVTTTLLSVTVPSGSDQSLLITHFANGLSDIAAWGSYTWNMYIDSIPVKSYFGVVDQLGEPNLMRKVGVDILVNAGQTLRVDAVAANPLPAGAPIAGYAALVSLIGAYGFYDYNRD